MLLSSYLMCKKRKNFPIPFLFQFIFPDPNTSYASYYRYRRGQDSQYKDKIRVTRTVTLRNFGNICKVM